MRLSFPTPTSILVQVGMCDTENTASETNFVESEEDHEQSIDVNTCDKTPKDHSLSFLELSRQRACIGGGEGRGGEGRGGERRDKEVKNKKHQSKS